MYYVFSKIATAVVNETWRPPKRKLIIYGSRDERSAIYRTFSFSHVLN